jgi:cytoskeleton protein RodZ
MSSERAEQPAAPDNNPRGVPGIALAAQREAMGWTVEQVADQLKLAVRQVVALEAGDYEHLPSPAVTRGFVRAYAKLMKMDPVPLVAQIAMDTPPAPDNSAAVTRRASPASFSASKFPNHSKRSSLPVGWIAGAAVAIVAIAAAWHFGLVPHRSESTESATQAATPPVAAPAASATNGSSTTGSAVETLQNPSVPLISVPSPNAAPAANAPAPANPAPNAAASSSANPAANPTAPAKPPVQLASTATVPAAAAAPAAAAGANALVLNVREDSWIQVTPAKGGAPLISRLVKGGSTETVNVDGPVRVIVGNPTAVSATLRGNAVALPAVPGKTISRINLQ